jgi:hypothetical protein
LPLVAGIFYSAFLLQDIMAHKLKLTKTKLRGFVRKQTIPTERPPLFGEVSAKFADRGCPVVSAMDPHDR